MMTRYLGTAAALAAVLAGGLLAAVGARAALGAVGDPARPGAGHGAVFLAARIAAGMAVGITGVVLVLSGGSALLAAARALAASLGAAAG